MQFESVNQLVIAHKSKPRRTLAEEERRTRQIELLQSCWIQLEHSFTKVIGNTSRTDLMQSNSSRLWEDNEDDDPIASFEKPKSQSTKRDKNEIIEEQNKALESLSHIISRQKDIAIKIGDEVDTQNGM